MMIGQPFHPGHSTGAGAVSSPEIITHYFEERRLLTSATSQSSSAPAQPRETYEQIRADLDPTSGVPERIHGLLGCGLSRGDIAAAVGVQTQEAVRLWQNGSRVPSGRRYATLDTLRYVVLRMLDSGMQSELIASWFRARNEKLDDATPRDRFAEQPERVLAVALHHTDRHLSPMS
jgi:hypothetical protein